MRFRLHSIPALMIVLLLTSLAFGQQAPPPTQPTAPAAGQSSGQEEQNAPPAKAGMQEAAPAPIEPVLSGPYPVMSKAAEDRGRQVFEMWYRSQSGQIWAILSPGLKHFAGKEEHFVEYNKKLRERMGTESQTVNENIVPYILAPDTVYTRVSNFANVRFPVVVSITLNQRGQVDNMTINPSPTVAEGRFAGYSDANKYKLPFADEWLVYAGGRNSYENGYALSDDQRFALDFVYLKNGRMFSGAGGVGSKASDYYCFGQPILAPADGKITRAEQGYDDNPPGKPSGDPADGNVVAIYHGNGESTFINHLKQNSLKVKVGEMVKQGQELAECGNSGAGPVPHLHLQLQKGAGNPLPMQFVDYTASGTKVDSGEPKRGQLVKNNPTTAASNPATGMSATPATKETPASK